MATMKGKRVLVTGATSGIGKETARSLARLGAQVVIIGRSAEKTRAAAEELRRSTGNQDIDFLLADLSLLADTRRVAGEFLEKYGSLDVLVNNAGVNLATRETTSEGLERTFATNHLSYFLLTNLLLPALEKGARARVVSVSSGLYRGQKIDFDDLQAEKKYSMLTAYSRSKLMNILFTRELARRVKDRGITANALHPGVVATNLTPKDGLVGLIGKVIGLFAISSDKGAETSVYLASSPEVEGVTGEYFAKSRRAPLTGQALDDAAAKRLWDVSAHFTGV